MSSIRNYLSQAELAEFADITITDSTEADDQISQAEELIDAYVGPQEKFFGYSIEGLARGGSTTELQLDTDQIDQFYNDQFLNCMVEIIGGANAGLRRRCTASTKAGVVTIEAFPSAIDTTSFYKIYQIAKFPRICDVYFYDKNGVQKYYKSIPEAIKRATAAQMQFIIEMGASFFSSDKVFMKRERLDDYEYEVSDGAQNIHKLIAPKAKTLLRGLVNRKGAIIV